MPYSLRLRQVYAELYEVQIIENKETVWLHPLLALELSEQTSYYKACLYSALQDSLKRNQNQYYITQISDFGAQAKMLPELELALFRYKGCQVSLIDTPGLLALDVRHPQSYWQYLIDLKTLEVSMRKDLLLYWGMAVNGIINKRSSPPHQQDLLSAAEIERTDFNRPQQRLIPETRNITFDPKITLDKGRRVGVIEFTEDGNDYYVETTVRFARSMASLRQLVQQTLLADDADIRSKLRQMGYNSPLLPQYDSQMETDNIGSMQIGEHKIYYRLSDGFVDANSICRISNKDLRNWLKTDSTWDLFAARAKELDIEFNSSKKTNSYSKRVSAAFPSLIERKRGSSLNGGGSWIDNELAIQLLI